MSWLLSFFPFETSSKYKRMAHGRYSNNSSKRPGKDDLELAPKSPLLALPVERSQQYETHLSDFSSRWDSWVTGSGIRLYGALDALYLSLNLSYVAWHQAKSVTSQNLPGGDFVAKYMTARTETFPGNLEKKDKSFIFNTPNLSMSTYPEKGLNWTTAGSGSFHFCPAFAAHYASANLCIALEQGDVSTPFDL